MVIITSSRLHPILSIHEVRFSGPTPELLNLLEKLKSAGAWDSSLKQSIDFQSVQDHIAKLRLEM